MSVRIKPFKTGGAYSTLAEVKRITVHGLRHSHVSLLISLDENPLQIKERLRHEDIGTTLGTYDHFYPNSNFEVAKKAQRDLLRGGSR